MENVFIIGAGANSEIQMPTGVELKSKIAQMLYFYFEFGSLKYGDKLLLSCLKNEVNYDNDKLNELLTSARSIHDALPQAISIDNFLDAHRDNKNIEFCGKLGIVYSILDAERNSLLFTGKDEKFDFGKIEQSWYHPFFQIVTENCRKSDLSKRLKGVGFIIFNYDRCFEYYFSKALQNYYLISEDEANEIVNELNIIHPYGSVGVLPFQKSGIKVKFGENTDISTIVNLAHQIKTFTESRYTDEINNNRNIIEYFAGIKKIIFLGFAFHKLNMDILFNEPLNMVYARINKNISCFGSAYNISNNDIKAIIKRLVEGFGEDVDVNIIDKKCYEFINYYWRSLAF
jgi:hypothetical protein